MRKKEKKNEYKEKIQKEEREEREERKQKLKEKTEEMGRGNKENGVEGRLDQEGYQEQRRFMLTRRPKSHNRSSFLDSL